MTQRINLRGPVMPLEQHQAKAKKTGKPNGQQFQGLLQQELAKAGKALKISAHAQQRLDEGQMQFSDKELQRLSKAIKLASEKGSKESLILMDNAAVIVSIKNNTLITVVGNDRMKENVFTNIDSAVIV